MLNNRRFILILMVAAMLIFPLQQVASARNTIKTSSLNQWTPSSLAELVHNCTEGSVIEFDADFDYTIDRCITPKVSITIKGCGKRLRTINKTNYVISLFDVENVSSFIIEDLILDGGSSTSVTDGTMPKEFFITVKNVDKVSFSHCTFQNIKTDYPNWHNGDQPYTIWVENYTDFSFCDNVVYNVDCPEFLIASLPKSNKDKNRIANISRNNMQFVRTSSAIEVRFGRYKINNNEIGVTHGSSVNAFGFDSEIIGNTFGGSHASSSIDLSEDYFFEYVSSNILVKDNYSAYAHDGFIMADHVKNIKIQNNTYRADDISEVDLDRYDLLWGKTERKCDLAIRLEHDASNISVLSNTFIGSNALVMLWSLGEKTNIRIENNQIINDSLTPRSSIMLSQVDGAIIRNNTFVNAGRSLSYLDSPQFIAIGPTASDNASERYIKNLKVINNSFSFTNKSIEKAFILAHTIYDKEYCHTLSTLNNIIVKRNKASFVGDILLVTDDFINARNASVSVRRNSFNNGRLLGNVVKPLKAKKTGRRQFLETNSIVDVNGSKYYVLLGGVTADKDVIYNDNDYFEDGSVLLRRIYN